MVLRLAEIILIFAILIGAAYYLINTYIVAPRRKAAHEIASTTTSAIDKAKVDYLEIRKAWLSFYALSRDREFYADAMDDITIPEVAKFQRAMVVLNQDYNDLKDASKINETFVGKVVSLRTVFDDAVLAAKKNTLM